MIDHTRYNPGEFPTIGQPRKIGKPPVGDRDEHPVSERQERAGQLRRSRRKLDCGEVFWSWASPQQK